MATTKIRGNTQIIPGTITDAEISSSAAISTSKLADGANFALKSYVDSAVQGLDIKESVLTATTANITLAGTQTIDGVALSVGNRVLVKDQSSNTENGIYVVASGLWTRATDAVTGTITSGAFTFVESGTVNSGTGWVLTTQNPITTGSSAMTFSQFSRGGSVTAGDTSITVSGNAVSVNTTGSTLAVSSGLKVASGGITGTELNTSVAGAGLTGGGGSALAVTAADSSITVNADSIQVALNSGGTLAVSSGLKVASGGITGTELNTSVAGAGLTGGGGSALAVATADTSITVNADSIQVALNSGGTLAVSSGLKVASAGITEVEIASGSLSTTGGLQGGSSTKLSIKLDSANSLLSTSSSGLKIDPTRFIKRETPSGTINGSNATFTLANTPIALSEEVFLNGILQDVGAGNDYTISGGTITMLSAPISGDKLRVNYIY